MYFIDQKAFQNTFLHMYNFHTLFELFSKLTWGNIIFTAHLFVFLALIEVY